jgi:hypothetical protein
MLTGCSPDVTFLTEVLKNSSCPHYVCTVFNVSATWHQPSCLMSHVSCNWHCTGASCFNDDHSTTMDTVWEKNNTLRNCFFPTLSVLPWLFRIDHKSLHMQFFSSLLVLQPCEGLELLHGFVRVNFSGVGQFAPRQNPTWRSRDYVLSRGYHSAGLACVALPGACAPVSRALQVISAQLSTISR